MKIKIIERFGDEQKEWFDYENYLDSIVENPIGTVIPDGYYMIRGNKREHRNYYYVHNGIWYLSEEVKKDNGHYYCDSVKFNLFPSLPEKEWDKIKKVGWKRLNKVWQRHLHGYLEDKDLRRMIRGIRLDYKNIFID